MANISVRHPFRTTFGLLLLFFILQGSIVCCAADSKPQPKAGNQSVTTGSAESVRVIHSLINEYRSSQGLKPLELNAFLGKVAADHSRDMSKGKVDFGHAGFEQRTKAIRQKVKLRSIAENVGANMGQADPEKKAVEGWLKSPGHLKNIKGDFDMTGIGVAKSGKGVSYFTQIFVKKLQ
ncbi:MAG: CAP domain-containing protein [Deltaproteobacteria bacterium HGW-Deltaproteobacteria-15]|jgi:uncharacterized protein YkwD|nr:MAG: CAP domain-containing protein [Deltaproteobacteria bacterium HGW-Deltaproteobacteria-15]